MISASSGCSSFIASGGDGAKVHTALALGQSLIIARFKDNLPSAVECVAATGWLTSITSLIVPSGRA
jgi:hypothetical protein